MKASSARLVVAILATVATLAACRRAPDLSLEVFKSPTCGCCTKWVEHMRQAGFTVTVTDIPDAELSTLKDRQGIPAELRSCHTARIGRYTVEGHVPAADVKRLLDEQPAESGIAVGGMPIGSPGMEVPNGAVQRYEVRAFNGKAAGRVFATHGQ